MTFTLTPPEYKDIRFLLFKSYIFRMFHWKWQCEPRWGPMEAKQLKSLLIENPKLTEREFALGLKNIAESDDIPDRQRPGYWLPKLDSYIVHNHNVYGRNPDAKTGETFAERDANSTRAAAGRVLANLERNGQNGVALTQANERRLPKSTTFRPRALPSAGD